MSTSVTHGLDPAGRDTAATVAGSPVIWYAYDLSPGFASLGGDASDNGDTG